MPTSSRADSRMNRMLRIAGRAILGAALVLNGSAPVFAAMPAGPHRGASLEERASPPCHGERAARGSQTAAAHEPGAQAKSLRPAHAGCCDAGVGDCACGHALAPPAATPVGVIGRAPGALFAAALARYASPALPRLSRPPIG